ncbi:MAG TPA: hypothetical protein VGL03_11625 [Thermoanaerobaculia bacterium]
MITGFNTDVKHRNRVFHIQTEDKGESNPCVESLVYVGGEILATKRTSYAEVVQSGHDDHAVQDLMEQQHRTMIAAIQRGRFDGPNGSIQIPEGMSPTAAAPPEEAREESTAPPGSESPLAQTDRSLDQMVLDYLASDEVPDEVDLSLSPKPEFLSGRSVQTKLKATSGSPPRPLAGASVVVRILSTSARASTVFQGKTSSDGSCFVSFMVPALPNGSAAAVIRVTSATASSEIQYPIKRK